MLNKIKLNGREVNFIIKSNSLAKRLRIIIHQNGRLVITKPKRLSVNLALAFLKSQSNFVLSRLDQLEKKNKSLFNLPLGLNINNDLQTKENYEQHKLAAKKFIVSRLEFFNEFYSFQYNRISIRNQNTRWGSCSRQANLNFNYRLLFLPIELADYVIVHELCHVKELNHSANFWNLVKKTIPDYQQRRRLLKKFL